MKILKKKKKKNIFFFFFFFFFEIGNFFFQIGKKSPISHWERGQISAPENAKNIPGVSNIKRAKLVLRRFKMNLAQAPR